jgi:D-hexose-6-phosphate mutarotase
MAQSWDELNQLMVSGATRISGDAESGPIIEIASDGHHASISLFGAQLLHWRPKGHAPVLWLSDGAIFNREKPIRGGIPICWPWFANHGTQPAWPAHGFARTTTWQLDFAVATPDGIDVQLSMPREPWHTPYWLHMSRPVVNFSISDTLDIELTTENVDPHGIEFEEALHTYLAVGKIDSVSILGFENSPYIDKVGTLHPNEVCLPEQEPIIIRRETDRIYRQLPDTIELHDQSQARTLELDYHAAENAIVWNPWIEKTKRLDDIGPPNAYRGFVCIETGNVSPDSMELLPGEAHTLTTTLRMIREI